MVAMDAHPLVTHHTHTHSDRDDAGARDRERKASFFSCVVKNMRRICICIHTRIHAASDVRVKIISSHDLTGQHYLQHP